MGIVSITPAFGGKAPRSMTVNQDWTRTYQQSFLVVTDDPFFGARRVADAMTIAFGGFYIEQDENGTTVAQDIGAFMNQVNIAEDTSATDGCQWIATLGYGPYNPQQRVQDPTQRTPEVNFGSNRFQRAVLKDINTGDKVANSAGDPFDPAPERDDSRTVLTVKWAFYADAFDPTWASEYRDSINQGQWLIYEEKTVKCLDINATYTFNQDIGWYWETQHAFEINKDKWQGEYLDAGLYQLDSKGKKSRIILPGDYAPVSSPVPLDGNGMPDDPTSETNVYLDFDIYEEKDFSVLGLDEVLGPILGV